MSLIIEYKVVIKEIIPPMGRLKYEAKVEFVEIYEAGRGRRVRSKDGYYWSLQYGETEQEASKKAVAAAKEKYLNEQTG
ncbi:hypothetical protein [Rouxiella badensis]|jgi:hypothetical protein|uniref:hypothetical protein n=1 Tax=Rouxiella badensis TaxID=1646377 RepID=UPI0017882A7C|nr:hypothetical protein [Rouxiella badensis]QOI57937.1 hypothetical protein H2866_22845 [Rouxiella badensis subsp. acadiensis]